jgi:exodeoxyribonuclease V gamma subunit
LATTSLQSGEDGLLILQALTPEEAQSHLADLAEVYLQAWQAPLPLACKTACAWLAATHWPSPKARPKTDATQADTAESDAERLAALAMFAAQQAFDGGFFTGEASTSAHLQRAFERFEDIQDHLVTWAQRVYGPLASACTVAGSATPAEDAA